MTIPDWAIVLSAMLAGGVCWFVYRLVVQNGRTLLRLNLLEASLRSATNISGFKVRNTFESDNVLMPIMYLDEYRVNDCRFNPDDVIIDIGAHIGTFAYLCHAKGSRAVHCFEPSALNFELLQTNVASLPGVHSFRTAVWRSDCERRVKLTLSGPAGHNTGAGSVLAGGHRLDFSNQTLRGSNRKMHDVSAVSLDEILERFDRVKLLKIDCEGSEFPILLTSLQLHRIERIVGEAHEIDPKMMTFLDPASCVAGYTSYRVEDLVHRLQTLGFSVEIRRGTARMHWFDARR